METEKEFITETLLRLLKCHLIDNRQNQKHAMYLSFSHVDGHDFTWAVHLLFILSPSGTNVNIFGTASADDDLSQQDSMTQYASASGGVLRSQIEEMVDKIFYGNCKIGYLHDIQFFKGEYDGEVDLGAEFVFSMPDSVTVQLKYL